MSSPNNGNVITTLNGKRCTAVAKPGATKQSSADESKETTANAQAQNTAAAAAQNTVADFSVAQATAAQNTIVQQTAAAVSVDVESASSTESSSLSLAILLTTPDAQLETATIIPILLSTPLAELAPPPPPASTSISDSIASLSSLTAPQAAQPSDVQSQIVQTSGTDSIQAAPTVAAQTTRQQATALSDATPSSLLTESAIPLFSTIGVASASRNSAPGATAVGSSSSTNGAADGEGAQSGGNSGPPTVAVAGGVVGGVVALSVIAFLLWTWRRRWVKRNRRSTLLTPLTPSGSEKSAYVINRGSIGPTPIGEKVKATLSYNVKRLRGVMSRSGSKGDSGVNMNRGNSQFMDPVSTHSRHSSFTIDPVPITSMDRFQDWWSRLTADISFKRRLRNRSTSSPAKMGGIITGMGAGYDEKQAMASNSSPQPDFLTLLSMDDRQLDREAQRRRVSRDIKNGSAGSIDGNFLGGLNLNFGRDDPFSDVHALHNSAKVAPLAVSRSNNPFSDANAVSDTPKPNTYVADIRRSRGQSVSGGPNPRAPSTVYRDSAASVESFATRRNKFRSDPFDLDRPELLSTSPGKKASVTSSTAATVGSAPQSRLSGGVGVNGDIRRPASTHRRAESFTSKYSSGVSMGDWSDPGPDVGPAVGRLDGPGKRESPTAGWRDRQEREAANGEKRQSGWSQNSVGKAM